MLAQTPEYSLLNLGQGYGYGIAANTIIAPGGALAINDSGWVLIASLSLDSLYLWRNGSIISLNPFPANTELLFEDLDNSVALLDVNNQNKVVANFIETFNNDTIKAYLWQNGSWSQLAQPVGFDNTVATKINDNLEITGYYYETNEEIERPLYWQNNMPMSFSFGGFATSLNDNLILVGGDFASVGWKWENFVLDTIFTTSSAIDINEIGSVIGNFGLLYKDENSYLIESLLDTTGNGYNSFYPFAINDLDQIVGAALFGNETRAVLLSPYLLELTSPQSGELWIASEQDTIRWISNLSDSIEIEFSADSGNTFETLEGSFPASAGEYVWSIPDTLLSRKCLIRINDVDLPGVYSESNLFKIKGYYLTRITPDGDYEKFIPNEDGWRFGNNSANMWPQSWWQQFNYNGIDPLTFLPYGIVFSKTINQIFPDWQLWAETFGTRQSYWDITTGLYSSKAIKKWSAFNSNWGGSCYGFAAASFLGFNYKTEFLSKHPGIPNYTNLFELNVTDNIRKAVNHYYIHQKGQIPFQNDVVSWNKRPLTTLAEVKQMFLDENRDIKTISLINKIGSGGHTVAPYKVEKDASVTGRYRIYVYDSNAPGSDSSFVVVDSTFNVWVDSMGLGWAGLTGLFLEPPISNYLAQPVLPKRVNPLFSPKIDSLIEFYASYNSEFLMTSGAGNSAGYVGDSLVFELSEGIPVIPKVGGLHPPIGYFVPIDEYFISMNNFSDSSAYLTVFGDVIYDYQRYDATVAQTDRFYYHGNFSVISDDADTKNIELSTVIERDSTEKTIYLENTTITQSDSLDLSVQDFDKLTFKNYGSQKSYDLRSIYAMPGSGASYLHTNINLTANTSHQIAPGWTDLTNTPVTIYIDVGIDGTIEDTLQIANQITNIEDRGNLYLPKEYKLKQNYPNPFNPTTTIEFDLPKSSEVTLKVFNILGEEVTTLLSTFLHSGSHKYEWDASNLSSGVYLYRLQAGDPSQSAGQGYVKTRKMVLMR
jgi:hypothetical protein